MAFGCFRLIKKLKIEELIPGECSKWLSYSLMNFFSGYAKGKVDLLKV